MSKELSITLPDNVAVEVAERVMSGAYGTESEVVHRGLVDLLAREEAAEAWLRGEAAEAYDEVRDHPCLTWGVRDARAHLTEVHAHHLARPRP